MKKLIILLFCICFSLPVIAQNTTPFERIEPPFWWADMQRDSIQLLLYGKGISNLEPDTSSGIIHGVSRTENPNYLFLDIDLSQQKAGSITLQFQDPQDQKTIELSYELLERRKGSAERKGFDASDVIYLIMPDRFANGNPENDAHPETIEGPNRADKDGRHGGDLQGVIDHLDYLEDLGVTALWSTPLCEDNLPTVSYHTYAQTNLYRIDPRFGTNADYKRLAAAMHERDMKLIMDYVTNHWGTNHWLLKDPPNQTWIHQHGKMLWSNHRKEIFSDPYASKSDYKGMVEGWFDVTMADVNQDDPLVLTYLIQNALWWIEYADLDGFRVDTYPYNDLKPMAQWVQAIMDEYPNFNVVGEGWMHNSLHLAYWQKDSALGALNGFNSNLPAVMDFTLTDALMVAFSENNSYWESGLTRIYKNLQNDFLYPDPNNILIFAENHDTNRINDTYPDLKDYKRLMTVLMTHRGIPQIYYGSEIGMAGKKQVGDGDIRRDFPGGWPGDPKNAFTQKGRNATQEAYHSFTKKLLNWRKSAPAIHSGKTLHFVPENDVYVYFRTTESQRVMVVINNDLKDHRLDLNRFQEGLNSITQGVDVFTEKTFDLTQALEVPAESAYILELE